MRAAGTSGLDRAWRARRRTSTMACIRGPRGRSYQREGRRHGERASRPRATTRGRPGGRTRTSATLVDEARRGQPGRVGPARRALPPPGDVPHASLPRDRRRRRRRQPDRVAAPRGAPRPARRPAGAARLAGRRHPARVLPHQPPPRPHGADGPAGLGRPSSVPTTPPTCSPSSWPTSGTPPWSTGSSSCPRSDASCCSCSPRTRRCRTPRSAGARGIPVGSIGPTRARALEQLRRTRAFRRLTSPDADGSTR